VEHGDEVHLLAACMVQLPALERVPFTCRSQVSASGAGAFRERLACMRNLKHAAFELHGCTCDSHAVAGLVNDGLAALPALRSLDLLGACCISTSYPEFSRLTALQHLSLEDCAGILLALGLNAEQLPHLT
jgi:hypothetical protein